MDSPLNVSREHFRGIANTTELNNTILYDNGTHFIGDDLPLWSRVFSLVQLGCTVTGFFANIMTLITLHVSPAGFSRLILILFRHQSLVDSWVCGMASIVILQPQFWLTGNKYIDIFICHIWHGQAFYWGATTLSTYTLVFISFERYVAVLHPFKHATLAEVSKKHLTASFFLLYIFSVVVNFGGYIQTRMEDGKCVSKFAFDGPIVEDFFFGYVIYVYIISYFVPAVVMGTAYSIISRKLRARRKDATLGQSDLVERAGSQVTKTAITVTVIFLITIGYDTHYYLLGSTGTIVYELNSPYQKVGIFLSNLNSCANPFVYALLIPAFRRSLVRTFSCKKQKSNMSSTPQVSTVTGEEFNTDL